MIRVVLIVAILCCALCQLCAQSPASRVTQKYNAYQAQWEKPQLHIVFNQEKFSPGDTAWFNAYFLKQDLTFIRGREIIEINLVDSTGLSLLHISSSLNDGRGHGQLIIPRALKPGIFLIAAYSSQMLNFPGYFFEKKIEIVGEKVVAEVKSPFIKARPEGGHLVRGLTTSVVVRSYPPKSSVQIADESGAVLGTTITDEMGFGSISFLPGSGSYYAKMAGAANAPLPKPEEDGCNLLFIPSTPGHAAKVQVTAPANSALRQNELLMLISAGGRIRHSASIMLSSQGSEEFEIPLDGLNGSICHISLLNADGTLLASRDFFHSNPDPIQVKMNAGKSQFQIREKAEIEVALTDKAGNAVSGEFSISVLNMGLFERSGHPDELANPFSSEQEVNLKGEAGLRDHDLFLALNTQADPWERILSNEQVEPVFKPTNFLQKKGKAIFSGSGKLVSDAQILFYLQQNNVRQESKIENGNTWLPLTNIYGDDQLLYYGETFYYVSGEKHGEEIPDLKIEWEDTRVDLPHAPMSSVMGKDDLYGNFTARRRLIEKSFGFYSARKQTAPAANAQSEFEEELEPDVTINVQDYILFPTMAELIKEVIPSLFHRKTGRKEMVRVALPDKMWAMVSGDPVYVIDGMVTKNTKFFLSLKPADLLTVQIVNNQHKLERLGMLGKNGIVIVKSKKGDVRESADPASRIEGLSIPLTFRTPDYSIIKDRNRPDFRSTIYWNPTVKTNEHGKTSVEFFWSDDIGTMSIQVEGITADGRPFSAIALIEVGSANKQ